MQSALALDSHVLGDDVPVHVAVEVDDVGLGVVEEREEVASELIRVTRKFVTQCLESGDVYCLGQEVDWYEAGVISGHEGSWLAGNGGAEPGLLMPGSFAVGARYVRAAAPDGLAEETSNDGAGQRRQRHREQEVLRELGCHGAFSP